MADSDKKLYIVIDPAGERKDYYWTPEQATVARGKSRNPNSSVFNCTIEEGGETPPLYAPSPLEQMGEPAETMAALALGDIESRTAGIGSTSAELALNQLQKNRPPIAARRGTTETALLPERTGMQEAERIREAHPIAHGVGTFTGMLGPGALSTGISVAKKAAGEASGRVAGGAAMATAAAGQEAVKQAAERVGAAVEGREEPRTGGEELLNTALSGVAGGLTGTLLPSSIGMQYRGIGRLERAPVAQMMAAARKGGGGPSWRGWTEGPETTRVIREGVKGTTPAEIAASELEGPMVGAAKARQIANQEATEGLLAEYHESPAGMAMIPAEGPAKTLWRLAKEAVHEDPAAGGKTMSMHNKERFITELDKMADMNFAVRGEGASWLDKVETAPTQIAQGERYTVPIEEARKVLGNKRVEAIIKKSMTDLPEDLLYREKIGPGGKTTVKTKVPAEDLLDLDNLVISPYRLRSEKLEQIRQATDEAALAAKKVGERDPLWEQYAASLRAQREQYQPGPAAGEEAVINPGKKTEKTVKGYPARMHNISEKQSAEDKLMQSAGLPPNIGTPLLSGNESKAFRNTLKGSALGESEPAATALREIANSADIGPALDKFNAIMGDLALAGRLQGEEASNRLIFTGILPHFFGSLGLKDQFALRQLALEEAVNANRPLKIALKGLRQGGTRAVVAGADYMTREDWSNLDKLSKAREQSKEQVK